LILILPFIFTAVNYINDIIKINLAEAAAIYCMSTLKEHGLTEPGSKYKVKYA
jgi:hypothetical protein